MKSPKNKVGRPKKEPTVQPSLRVNKAKWERMKVKYPNQVNRMFNEWIDEKLSNNI